MKHYCFTIFVDFPIDNRIDMSKRIRGKAEIYADTLRESLYELCNMVFDSFDTNAVLIGLSHTENYCDGKPINESYWRRLVNGDTALKKFMWC